MLTAFARAFRTPDLRTQAAVHPGRSWRIFRLGSCHPDARASTTPPSRPASARREPTAGSTASINLFSGGALLQLSVFALGIMPYITASIIMQLLTVVIPRFEALKKEGQAGTTKLTQYTRYLTIGLAVLQSTALIAIARNPGRAVPRTAPADLVPNDSLPTILHHGPHDDRRHRP